MKNWKSLPTEEITCWLRKQNWYLNADTKTNTCFPTMTPRNYISCIVRNHYIVTVHLLIIFGWRLLDSHQHVSTKLKLYYNITQRYICIYLYIYIYIEIYIYLYIFSIYIVCIYIYICGQVISDILYYTVCSITEWLEKWDGISLSHFFKLEFTLQGSKATTKDGVTRKRSTKRLKHTGNLFRRNLQLVNWCLLVLD